MRVRRRHEAVWLATIALAILLDAAAPRAQSAVLPTPPDPVPVLAAAPTPAGPGSGAQGSNGRFRRQWFEPRPWFEPLVADPRGAQITLNGLAFSRAFPFSLSSDPRIVWAVSLGKELPLVLREKNTDGDQPIPPGAWGFGFWLPVSFHGVGDLQEPARPVVNTDYRFGLAFKAAHGLNTHTRDRLAFKLQVSHESSHVGDRFLLSAVDRYGDSFDRIDVKYEFVEVGASWDRVMGANATHQLTTRLGGLRTLDNDKPGFYRPDTSSGRQVTVSRRNFEPGFGIEYFHTSVRSVGFFASLDVRDRTVYNYHKQTPDQRDRAQWSYSMVCGLRPLRHKGRDIPEVVLSAYYGVNPNGQFRSQPRYWLVGLGLHVRG